MAQRVVVEMLDDSDGSAAEETVRFGLDDASYEIDLSHTNAARLRAALARFVDRASPAGRLSRPTLQTTVVTDVDPTAVRAWARANGIEVNVRGRISAAVVGQFRAAGN